MNEQSFVPKRNFIAEIDKRIHSLEFYLRAKWYQHNGERTRILLVDRTNEKEYGHLKLISFKTEKIVYSFSWTITSIYYPKASDIDIEYKNPYLRTPRSKEQLQKTWGNVDYIIGEIHDKQLNKSKIVYFNRIKLFEYLEATRAADYLFSKGISTDEQFQLFKNDLGIPLLGLERLGIIEHCDEIDFNDQTFQEQSNVNWIGKNQCYFINRWKDASEDMKTLQWGNFHLLNIRPQRKRPVTCTRLSDSKSKLYDSIQSLVDEILHTADSSVDLIEIRKSKEYNCLKVSVANILAGKQKTFKVKGTAYTVSSTEPPTSKGGRKKRVAVVEGGTNV